MYFFTYFFSPLSINRARYTNTCPFKYSNYCLFEEHNFKFLKLSRSKKQQQIKTKIFTIRCKFRCLLFYNHEFNNIFKLFAISIENSKHNNNKRYYRHQIIQQSRQPFGNEVILCLKSSLIIIVV